MTGLYIPLVTPFDVDGSVAVDALEQLATETLDAGARGLVVLGTTGEPAALTDDEKHTVVDVASRVCSGRDVSLIVGANTPAAVTEWGSRDDVTAIMSLVPPFIRPGEAGVVAYFEHLATIGDVPLIVYDIPQRTGQYLSADTLRRIGGIERVVGIKYAPGNMNVDTISLLADPPPDTAILGGDDPFMSPLLALGADGAIAASAHVATADFVRLIDLWHAGDVARARQLGEKLSRLATSLFTEPNPTVTKGVLHAQGRIPTAAVRLPLLPATSAHVDEAMLRVAELSV